MSTRSRLVTCVALLFLAHYALFAQRSARPSFTTEIRGQVRLAQGDAPANNVLVKLESYGSTGGRRQEIVTDRTGKFSFQGLLPAQYVITAHAAGFKDAQQTLDLQAASGDYIILRLIADESTAAKSTTGSSRVVNANVPPDAQKELDEGRAALHRNDVAQSVLHFEKAIKIYPEFLEAQLALGTALMDLRRWEEAERALRRTLDIDPKTANAFFALGEIYWRQAKNVEAINALTEGLKLEPRSSQAHFALARVYWQLASVDKNQQTTRTHFENSYREVKQALNLAPGLAEAHLLKGNLLLRAKRGSEALAEFEEYLKLDPKGQYSSNVRELVRRIRSALGLTDSIGTH